ncbi:MAG TPA: glyoxylate/hydroxypyruvate reductase A [Candidimonas sp.]|nr:glyoxylate/hydroxypyruvate reductase A [Candidimonas sp.]
MRLKIVVAASSHEDTHAWAGAFASAHPSIEFIAYSSDRAGVGADYAIVWSPPPALFAQEQRLKAVFNLGAGVDRLLAMRGLPTDLPVIRLEDAGMATQMAEYVLHGLADVSRGFGRYRAAQESGQWTPAQAIDYGEWPVGVMGLGAIGSEVAQAVAQRGYPTAGWSRTGRSLPGIKTYEGVELAAFLTRTRVLVNVLPLTDATRDILDRRHLGLLQRGGYLINVARGAHVVDDDLLALIDAGHLQGALLDVFRQEPLPCDHPYWLHPNVKITPHISAITVRRNTIEQVLRKVDALERGHGVSGIVPRSRGY